MELSAALQGKENLKLSDYMLRAPHVGLEPLLGRHREGVSKKSSRRKAPRVVKNHRCTTNSRSLICSTSVVVYYSLNVTVRVVLLKRYIFFNVRVTY